MSELDDQAEVVLKGILQADDSDERLEAIAGALKTAFEDGRSEGYTEAEDELGGEKDSAIDSLTDSLLERAEWVKTRIVRKELDDAEFTMGRLIEDIKNGAS